MPITLKTKSDRPLWPAIKKGATCKCPKCGSAPLFSAYLKTDNVCSTCGEDFSHHRADDLPPYLALVIVGHILVGVMLHLEMMWHISPINYLAVLVPLAIIMPLAMLPILKGGVIGLQWALRMHGFGETSETDSVEKITQTS